MRSSRLVLASVATGAVLAAALTAPAYADPTSPQCFQAQANVASQQNNVETFTNQLSGHNVTLQNAKDKLATDQAAVPVVPATITADQSAVSADQVIVNNDQASLRTAQANLVSAVATRDSVCNTAPSPVPTPVPTVTPAPTPAPVGLPAPSPTPVVIYKVIDGRKCHLVNGVWVPVTPPPCTVCTTAPAPVPIVVTPEPVPAPVVLAQPPSTVYVPAPSQSFTQIGGTAPVGAAATGDGSLAPLVDPVVPVPDPITLTVTVDLGNVLDLVRVPTLPAVPVVR